MKYLLDTNMCGFLIRQRSPAVFQGFQQYQPAELGISAVTLAELRYGADKSLDPAKTRKFTSTARLVPWKKQSARQSATFKRPGSTWSELRWNPARYCKRRESG